MLRARPAAFASLASLVLLFAAVAAPIQVQAGATKCNLSAIELLTGPLPVDVPNRIDTDDDPFRGTGIKYNPPSNYVNVRGSVEPSSDRCGARVGIDAFGKNYRTTVGLAADIDQNGDGMGDNWAAHWQDVAGQLLVATVDTDGDDLLNLDEFRWDLIPICLPANTPAFQNCRDHESSFFTGLGGDGWRDGPEIAYWNDEANDHLSPGTGLALLDPDRFMDTDGDGDANVNDTDSDNDGLSDGAEALVYGTFPEYPDSDCSIVATFCTSSFAPTTYHSTRQGTPGTGDRLNDSAELSFWEAMQPASWSIDHDGDGIANALLDPDSDNDGIQDGAEFLLGKGQVRPDRLDTDGDGVNDNDETAWSEDTDQDGLVNANDQDSDADGMPDGWEREYGFNMVVAADAAQDFDNDGLSNLGEFQHGTIPTDPDTEGDELQDGPEVAAGTNPFQWDTDGDNLPDAWEAEFFTNGPNPVVSDATVDRDGDSFTASWCGNVGTAFTNRAEYLHGIPSGWDSRPIEAGGDGVYWDGTTPNQADTDGDGLTDGYEVCSGLDPKMVDVLGGDDTDEDGLTNAAEIPAGTRHDDPDTDDDSLCDGGRAEACLGAASMWPGERDYQTLPLDADTDNEGWQDGSEALFWDQPGAGTAPDSDRDGLSNLHEADSDGDGLTDLQEHESTAAPDPSLADTDQDGLSDKQELDGWFIAALSRQVTSDPRVPDTDLDGLTDLQEKQRVTDPRLADSDADGLTDPVELNGWVVVANGVAYNVTSNPVNPDTDGEGLNDAGELSLGTDPRKRDTDADGLTDYIEDEDHDAQAEEGEPSATDNDSDDDRLLDGEELAILVSVVIMSDPLDVDTDEDGLTDYEEKVTYDTSRLNADTDEDFLPDGEEVGSMQAGGTPDRLTNPKDSDSDDDGLLDGAEVYFYGTSPLTWDTDCDGQSDNLDPNPYAPNVPPGEARPAAERACATAPTGSYNFALADLPAPPDPFMGASATAADADDVGLLVFDEDGTVTMLARAPDSEAPITVVQAVIWLNGQLRTGADGSLSSGSGRITAELQAMDEPTADEPGGNPWTHAVRMALPEGMVEATSATYGLTFVDANLNSATYTGETTGFQLEEVVYQDELNAADQQDYDDPTNTTMDASGWDYVHGNLTGTQRDVEPPMAASPILNVPGANQSAEVPHRYWIYRIVQPAQPSLVGAIVDDQLVLQAPVALKSPVKLVMYTNTSVQVPEEDLHLYTQASWFGAAVNVFKKVVQATTIAFSAAVQASVQVYNKAAELVKGTALAVYDELKNPRSPMAMAARVAIDIVGVGDVIDIVDGVKKGNWMQVGIGAACLAMTILPVLKGPVAAAKASFRVAAATGGSGKLLGKLGATLGGFVGEGAAGASKINKLNDAVKIASTGGKTKQTTLPGLEVILDTPAAASVGVRKVVDTSMNVATLSKQAATKTTEGATEFAKTFTKPSAQVTLDQVAHLDAKVTKYAAENGGTVLDSVELLAKSEINAVGGVISSAEKMSFAQAKGHIFTLEKVAEKVKGGMTPGNIDMGFSDAVTVPGKGNFLIRPDAVYTSGTTKFFTEYKNYDGVLKLTTSNKLQLQKYKALKDRVLGSEAHYVVKNGQVSKGFKELAKEYGIKLFDGNGVAIPNP